MNMVTWAASMPFLIVAPVFFSPLQSNRVFKALGKMSTDSLMSADTDTLDKIHHELSMLSDTQDGIYYTVSGIRASTGTVEPAAVADMIKRYMDLPDDCLWLRFMVIGNPVETMAFNGWMPRVEIKMSLFTDSYGNVCYGTLVQVPVKNIPPKRLKINASFLESNEYLEDHDGYFESLAKDPQNENYCHFRGMNTLDVFTNIINGEQFFQVILPAQHNTQRVVVLPLELFPEEHYELESPTALPWWVRLTAAKYKPN